jgi:2,3-bisphosphoglycerate-independent phosphoglycerate mutase
MNNKVALLILDGIGINEKQHGNAVKQAKKPNLDKLINEYPHTQLHASGKFVGLPDGQMGNSEVGHLNIGAGRVVYTGLEIINNAINKSLFLENEQFFKAIKHARENNSKVHLIGLVSTGGVHSSLLHLKELIKMMGIYKVNAVLHIISDGRDVAPKSFLEYYNDLKPLLHANNVKIGSIAGRYYTMDRDKN